MAAGWLAAAGGDRHAARRSRGPQPPGPGSAQRVARHAQPEHGQAEQGEDGRPGQRDRHHGGQHLVVEGTRGGELGRPVGREELQDRLVRQRVVHRVFQERVQQGGHDDEEEPFQVPPDQHPDQQAQGGVAGRGQDEGHRDAPQPGWPPERQDHDGGIAATAAATAGPRHLGRDERGRPVPGQDETPVERDGPPGGREHDEARDERDGAQARRDQGQVVAIHHQPGSVRAKYERRAPVRDHRADQQVPAGDEDDEQDPGQPVAGLGGQAVPDGDLKLLAHGGPPLPRSGRPSDGRSGRIAPARKPGG